ncbi:28S ribosomal protein S22, mitochondrial-like [Dreissena polymorpha]|uniref:Mitochondrial ribosomal protein S22 n=1 Tax=Dreissena polymorpha TaxID=45954 RepID=A0A9D4GRS0_DREPO|nr:28S ribosomal protein S22, mitochondrial-like [Dreissena polymorpha]KAH3821757.1 hypothetical protein DPMN_123524 [Dreissena polymorpha]
MAALSRKICFLTKLNGHSSLTCDRLIRRLSSSDKVLKERPDLLHLFLKPKVTAILKKLTGKNSQKTMEPMIARRAVTSKYKMLTDEELKQEMERARQVEKTRLQMPPYMNARRWNNRPLSCDPDIAPVLTSKYIFVDISEASKRIPVNHARTVLCRHKNGVLQHADVETHDRIVRTYLPVPGQEVLTPPLFEEDRLKELLTPVWYTYLLEYACTQLEPDNPEFLRVTHTIYEHIAKEGHFHHLEATRFFGPMAFHLAVIDKLESLIIFYIESDRLSDAKDVILLGQIVNDEPETEGSVFTIVQMYVKDQVEKVYNTIQTQSQQATVVKSEKDQRIFQEKVQGLEKLQNVLKTFTRKLASTGIASTGNTIRKRS